jgi:isocitrate dehydrogenase (NAD+)
MAGLRIVVLEGDQTGQELLDQALRVIDPEVIGLQIELKRFDLSLENRRRTKNEVCTEAARDGRPMGAALVRRRRGEHRLRPA